MNEKQIAGRKFLAETMNLKYEKFIKEHFYPNDFEEMDFSTIHDVNEWEAIEVYHLDHDDLLCEIDDVEEAYNQHGDRVIIDSNYIDTKYAFGYGTDIGFYVITMNDGTHYVGAFCGD